MIDLLYGQESGIKDIILGICAVRAQEREEENIYPKS